MRAALRSGAARLARASGLCRADCEASVALNARGVAAGASKAVRDPAPTASAVQQPCGSAALALSLRQLHSAASAILQRAAGDDSASALCIRHPATSAAAAAPSSNAPRTIASSAGRHHQHSAAAAAPPPFVEHGGGARRQVVAVAVSGGVDSAVAASMMQREGHEVFGVFMRNWNEMEEQGNQNCSVEREFQDARRVCEALGLPLLEADFVAQYWQRVFQPFLDQYARGLTPNPDLACNRAIKFDALLRHATSLGADRLATGHYARLAVSLTDGATRLLQGLDPLKDQSYFLASVPSAALGRCAFPLGGMLKADVRAAAAVAGLPTAAKRSSAGICFIGRRSFGDFLAQYVEPVPGRFQNVGSVDWDAGSGSMEAGSSGTDLGPCGDILAVTHGQRAGIGGAAHRMYVVGKDVGRRIVRVGAGGSHPALFCRSALLGPSAWVAGRPPRALTQGRPLELGFKARYGQPVHASVVQLAAAAAADGAPFAATRLCSYLPDSSGSGDSHLSPCGGGGSSDAALVVRFRGPQRAITPGQELVLYDGEVCLGAAPVLAAGPSLLETGEALPEGHRVDDSVHMTALRQQEPRRRRQGEESVMRAAAG